MRFYGPFREVENLRRSVSVIEGFAFLAFDQLRCNQLELN